MPKCKNCGARLSKLDNDICPICGTPNPLEGVTSETIEVTSNLDINSVEFKNFKPCTKFKTCIIFMFAGWLGAGFFYLNFVHMALIWAFLNIVVIEVGLGSILAFLTPLGLLWGYLIPVFIMYFINICVGLFYLIKHNLKDAHGEFLR